MAKNGEMKRRLRPDDGRIVKKKAKKISKEEIIEAPQISSAMFFKFNSQLGPPYHLLLDTNFINFSIRNKLDIINAAMDCLYAKCTCYVTDCVMGELETLGRKYRMALKVAKDERFERLTCSHKGIYADDCIVQRLNEHKCFIACTCDRDLRRRIRKIPGVPLMYIKQKKFTVERMPDAFGAPRI
ncbi:hypothetical protein ACOME3_006329 [Neoechinorhynchus agilis]